MCQRLFLASRSPLPRHARRDGTGLSVQALPSEATSVRRLFSEAKHFAVAGPGSPCGCGWPELSNGAAGKPVPPDEREAMRGLVSYLGTLRAKRYVVEIVLAWAGDEDAVAEGRCEVTLAQMRAADFRFRRQEVLRVRAGLKG